MSYPRRVAGLLMVAVLLLAGCRDRTEISTDDQGQLVLGSSEVEASETRGVAPGNRTLVLDGFSGSIHLTGTSGSSASLQFTKRARGNDDVDARNTLGEIQIDEKGDETNYTYTMTTGKPGITAVDVRGTVPAGTTVRIRLENGNIVLSGVSGSLDVENANGHVDIAGTSGHVRAVTGSGNVSLGVQTLPTTGTLTLETSNGNVHLTLPGASSARVEASTNAGHVTTRNLTFDNRRLQSTGAGYRFSGQLGRGNANIDLKTQNGNIVIDEGTIRSLPGSSPADTVQIPVDSSRIVPPVLPSDSIPVPVDTTGVI